MGTGFNCQTAPQNSLLYRLDGKVKPL